MFTATMVGAFGFMLMAIAIVDKIVWLTWVALSISMVAVFMGIKAECKQMDKDREHEDKIEELKRLVEAQSKRIDLLKEEIDILKHR